ncbi:MULTISPECIES: type I-F CRISPR-associated protein Csy2 [Acinetobacter]|uniref:Type I-F CRISPR-associated protein Csy2 n=1 Tax=Acinetobacter indicus TaxID=756892 RepID=A0A6C0Y8A2_9GAMM|nr:MULTISPECIES: type I-F CRISPR-associated protein Csy2 [Acinetobacter]QIC72092.1 type I-F CRISPR-associated protein Csy2 [Acinetobacter indicus]QKQ71507.1 type I-F CRISPR-associated protein Csy2 [Acinetobacter sp. 10FS3-1]
MRSFILIPNIVIEGANAISSPFTVGFPAMTAWLGSVHALQRKLREKGYENIVLDKCAVSCHSFDLRSYKDKGEFNSHLKGKRLPVNKDGKLASFVVEGTCDLEVSLLIEYHNLNGEEVESFLEDIGKIMKFKMNLASGSVKSLNQIQFIHFDEDEDEEVQLKPLLRKLMLGHVLIERRDLVEQNMNSGMDALDAVLDPLKVISQARYVETQKDQEPQAERGENDETKAKERKVVWTYTTKQPGWIIPIAVGFKGISPLGKALKQRDQNTEHRFAESLVTLGEFVMPFRIESLDQMLWRYDIDQANDLYLCLNN